jgi:hypothetical protein
MMTTLETTMKRCDLCKEPLPLEAFAVGPGARRSVTCLGCEKKATSTPDDGYSVPQRKDTGRGRPYRGVTGGMLLAGYVAADPHDDSAPTEPLGK